jgi:endonuclease IV
MSRQQNKTSTDTFSINLNFCHIFAYTALLNHEGYDNIAIIALTVNECILFSVL